MGQEKQAAAKGQESLRKATDTLTGGFDTFVSHKVSEECDVVAALQETLCKAVTEGMRVNDHRVYAIPDCQLF